jgi:transcriptional regulator with XRE-family HTH domain
MEVNVRKIQMLRIDKGLTQRALAKEAGISNTSLWKIEKGGGASPPTLKKIADVLGVRASELLED